MKKRLKIESIIFYILAVISLIVGMAFHGYRMHPENIIHYKIGVIVGILMIVLYIIFLLLGMAVYDKYKKIK